jgi:high-affinity iron transporter
MGRSDRRRAVVLLAMLTAVAAPAAAVDLKSGKATYDLRCSPCHGNDGRGDGPAAQTITPKPRNFHDAAFWKARTPEQIRTVVREGKPQTLMAGFEGVLSEAEIDDVIAYIHSFDPDGH